MIASDFGRIHTDDFGNITLEDKEEITIMSIKYIQPGDAIDYANASGEKIPAGIVRIGDRIGIAPYDIENGKVGVLHLEGVWELPCSLTAAVVTGQKLYFDGTEITDEEDDGETVPTAYPFAGYAVTAGTTSSETILVKIG